MSRSRRVFFNAALSVLQVAVNGGLYLVLYRFLYDTVGVAQLGVWSIVLAWTSVNNLASLGFGWTTTYFIPKYLARGERAYVQDLVQVAPAWKLLLGLRFDHFTGEFNQWTYANAATDVPNGFNTTRITDSMASQRYGVLYQPTPTSSPARKPET